MLSNLWDRMKSPYAVHSGWEGLAPVPVDSFTEEYGDLLRHLIFFHCLHWNHWANIAETEDNVIKYIQTLNTKLQKRLLTLTRGTLSIYFNLPNKKFW